MNKLLLTALVVPALSLSVNAGTINASCSSIPAIFASGNGGPINITCASFNSLGLVGQTLNSGSLTFTADMVLDTSIYPTTADTATLTFTPNQGFSGTSIVITNTAGSYLKTNSSPLTSISSSLNPANAVMVGVSSVGVGNSLTASGGSSNGSVFLQYNYSANTPEPATASILGLGLGLLAVGLRAKKHRS